MTISCRSRKHRSLRPALPSLGAASLSLALSLAGADAAWGVGEPTPGADAAINEPFLEGDYERWKGVFERPGREVYDYRHQILEVADPRPGMAVADIGAGSGLFTRLFAEAVGPTGRVFAVDIAAELVHSIERDAAGRGLENILGVVNTQRDVGLPPGSVDLAFICDTYHHFERPHSMMRSVYRALRPGGRLIVVDFERKPGVSPRWILSHVRAGKEVFTDEIRQVGFVFEGEADLMERNYLLAFRKPPVESGERGEAERGGQEMSDQRVLYDASAGGEDSWDLITDGVMGGLSSGELRADRVAGRDCLRMRGAVRLENNGGFVQMATDLDGGARFDASAYRGLEIDIYGNGAGYKVHLRTDATRLPWQSYRADFTAPAEWQRIQIPFSDFTPYRLTARLDLRRLRRLALVAIGRAFDADLCLARLALYP